MTINDYQIVDFDPNMAVKTQLTKYLVWREESDKETNPNEPVLDRSAMLQQIQNLDLNHDYKFWLIVSQKHEKVVGFSLVSTCSRVNPNYTNVKHVAFFRITLLKKFRRLGLGTHIFKKCIAEIKKHDAVSVIQTSTRDISGKQFCEKFGGILAMEGFDNRLYFDVIDWNLVNGWIQQGENLAKNDNVRLETFEKVPDQYLTEYCSVLNKTGNQESQGGLEGRGSAKPDSYRDGMKRLMDLGHKFLISIALEKDGKISGLTSISIRKETPSVVFQGMTGVLPDYRGRGLGKWLKADMLVKIREKYPNINHIRTGNANNNAPMLSINDRLGFKVHEHVMAYKFKTKNLLDQLAISD